MPIGVFQKRIKRRKAATDVVGMTACLSTERWLVFLVFDMFVTVALLGLVGDRHIDWRGAWTNHDPPSSQH